MVVTFAFLGLIIGGLVLTRRTTRKLRAGDEEWVERWRALDPERREAILHTMRSGEAVRDPEDAEFALRGVAQLEYVRGVIQPLTIASTPATLAILIGGVVAEKGVLVVVAGAGLAFSVVTGVLARRQNRQFQRSAEATRRISRD